MAADLLPEEQARVLIDDQLTQAGWYVCDRGQRDLINHRGNAVREVIMDAADLPAPDVLAVEIMEELEAALGEFAAIVDGLGEATA